MIPSVYLAKVNTNNVKSNGKTGNKKNGGLIRYKSGVMIEVGKFLDVCALPSFQLSSAV